MRMVDRDANCTARGNTSSACVVPGGTKFRGWWKVPGYPPRTATSDARSPALVAQKVSPIDCSTPAHNSPQLAASDLWSLVTRCRIQSRSDVPHTTAAGREREFSHHSRFVPPEPAAQDISAGVDADENRGRRTRPRRAAAGDADCLERCCSGRFQADGGVILHDRQCNRCRRALRSTGAQWRLAHRCRSERAARRRNHEPELGGAWCRDLTGRPGAMGRGRAGGERAFHLRVSIAGRCPGTAPYLTAPYPGRWSALAHAHWFGASFPGYTG